MLPFRLICLVVIRGVIATFLAALLLSAAVLYFFPERSDALLASEQVSKQTFMIVWFLAFVIGITEMYLTYRRLKRKHKEKLQNNARR